MKEIWYIERKSYRDGRNVEQIADAGGELQLYETFEHAKEIFEAYKREYKEQGRVNNKENFPYESFSIKSKYVKDMFTIYTLRPVQLKQSLYE